MEPLEDSGLSVRGSASPTRDSHGKRSRRKNSSSRWKQVIGSNSPSSEESDGDDIDSGSPYSSSYDSSNDERSGKKTGLSLLFRGLPKKMIQVLKQGGKGFEIFFEPLQVDVTTTAELFKPRRHYKEGTQLITQICRSNGLTLDPQDCLSKLERTPLYMVRPGPPYRRSSGNPSDRTDSSSRGPALDEARIHHSVDRGVGSQGRDCRQGQRERVCRTGDNDSRPESRSVARRVPPEPNCVIGWGGEDGAKTLGDRGGALEGPKGSRQLLREETGVHGDRRRGSSGYQRIPLTESTTFAPKSPLPGRNWCDNTAIGTRLVAAMPWLETDKCPNDTSQRTLEAKMLLGQTYTQEAVARVVALAKAGKSSDREA